MTTYHAGISRRDGNVDGWIFELPGCRAIGSSVEDVRELLPVVTAEYVAWLRRHGEHAADADAIEVVEDVDALPEFSFEADRRPLSKGELEQAIQRIGYAYDDLVALASELPDVVLDWRPPKSSVKIDAIFPDVRSIRDMLTHVAQAMSFHVRGVGKVAERVPGPEGTPDLATAFDITLARLRSLDEEELAGKVYRVPGRGGEAEWTVRKSLRRVINHQRFHTREMQQRLCWLTLGVPEVIPPSRE